MKKFIGKFLTALFPLIVYVIFFIIFEPYNYWGLKPFYTGQWTKPLARCREYMRNSSENIILGDSRMNHFDLNSVEQMTGERWANLSSGGQQLNLSEELFIWANERVPVKNLVIDASFWQMREGSVSPQADEVFYIAEHPVEYIFTWDYAKLAWDEMLSKFDIKEKEEATQFDPEIEKMIDDDYKYRDDFLEYALYNIRRGCNNYSIDQAQIDHIINMVEITKKNGGDVKILIPCVQESIWDYVIEPLELEDEIAAYKRKLAKHAVIYDMEWKNELCKQQDIWGDGFHFKDMEVYRIYTNELFGETDANVRVFEEEKE